MIDDINGPLAGYRISSAASSRMIHDYKYANLQQDDAHFSPKVDAFFSEGISGFRAKPQTYTTFILL